MGIGESDGDKDRRAEFYGLMGNGKYKEAWDYLIKNGDLIDDMKVSDIARHYSRFKKVVSIGQLSGLTKILKERVFGKDAGNIFP